jgi:large subunit ribosomal protein L10e
MARLRKNVTARRLERPYTRVSKYRRASFVKARPHLKVVRFDMGNLKDDSFDTVVSLISDRNMQIRQESIEAARLAANKFLEEKLGKLGYYFKVRMYPHHILRENPLATGAGADRLSTGMSHAFGKVIGIAAQVKKGKVLFEVHVTKDKVDIVKKALKKATYKLPLSGRIVVEQKVAA